MFHYKVEAHDGREWRTASKPINEVDAKRQLSALIANGIPARLTALLAVGAPKEHTMTFIREVIEPPATQEELVNG